MGKKNPSPQGVAPPIALASRVRTSFDSHGREGDFGALRHRRIREPESHVVPHDAGDEVGADPEVQVVEYLAAVAAAVQGMQHDLRLVHEGQRYQRVDEGEGSHVGHLAREDPALP